MPGSPSSSCAMESPTGCTKQLISVAERSVPAADWMRPAGRKPPCNAPRNRASQCARFSGFSARARARATRRLTSATVRSSSLAYFSSSTSSLMDCGGKGLAAAVSGLGALRVLDMVVSVSWFVVRCMSRRMRSSIGRGHARGVDLPQGSIIGTSSPVFLLPFRPGCIRACRHEHLQFQ